MVSPANGVLSSHEPPDPRTLASLTVRDALAVPAMRRGLPQVLAGHDNLDRHIRWVHAGEVSNIASMLIGGELLLTTGMGIGARDAEQRAFIERLAAKGIAALVVELGSTFARMPSALIEVAERRRLPLIALNREIPFVAVTEAVHSQIVSSHYALMRRGEKIRQHLRDLILDGDGISEVLSMLASTLRAPVFLEGPDGRLLSHATPPGYDLEPIDIWDGARHAVDSETSYCTVVRRGSHTGDGRLVVLDLSSQVDTLAKVAVDHAADIIALALLRERQEDELVGRQHDTFLADLADGRIAPTTVARVAVAAGLEHVRDLVLPLAAEVETSVATDAIEWVGALEEVRRRVADAGVALIVGRREHGSQVLALAALRDLDQRDAAAEVAAAALRSVLARRVGADKVVVVAGRACAPDACGRELRLAERSAASATVLDDRTWHEASALELRCLLWGLRSDPDLRGFVERSLGALVEHDRRRKQALLPTLEALVASGGRKAQTARALHLNRQALYQRLARIEQILGVDLADAERLLSLSVAVCARQYLDGA